MASHRWPAFSTPPTRPWPCLLRPGNRPPHNADDHIEVLDLALAQLPVAPMGLDPDDGVAMLVRTDAAGASHDFVDALVERGIEFSIGFEMRKRRPPGHFGPSGLGVDRGHHRRL